MFLKGLINCMCIPLLGAETTTQDPNPYKGGLPILTWIKNFSEWCRGGVIYLQIFSTGIQPRGLDEALSYVVLTILYGKSKGGFVPTPLSATSIKNLPFSSKSSGRQPWQLMLMLILRVGLGRKNIIFPTNNNSNIHQSSTH